MLLRIFSFLNYSERFFIFTTVKDFFLNISESFFFLDFSERFFSKVSFGIMFSSFFFKLFLVPLYVMLVFAYHKVPQ